MHNTMRTTARTITGTGFIEVGAASGARAETSVDTAFSIAGPELEGPPPLSPLLGLRLERAGNRMWRAVDATRRVIGHIQPMPHIDGTRYRARRYKPATRSFLDLGDFWSADEAAWCLHYSS